MFKTSYLDALDGILNLGLGSLSPGFLETHLDFVLQQQCPDGGFRGRAGASDLYFTDFGLRCLSLLSKDPRPFGTAAEWLTKHADPRDVIDCFCLLNAKRMLGRAGMDVDVDAGVVLKVLNHQMLPAGGFSRPGGAAVSAYSTFLAVLCLEMLGEDLPAGTAPAVRTLKVETGGYSETPAQEEAQTNSTAAAAAALTIVGALQPGEVDRCAAFLASMQTSNGGFLAQPEAPEADLLSTFTAATTLFGLDAIDRINGASVARFAGSLACEDGGFRACASDDEPDVEYTYYGLGTLAILRAYVLAKESL